MEMDSDINSNFTEDDLAFTVKLLAQEPEILSLIGENEKVLRNIRAKTGASVSITEGSVADRLVTVTGTLEELYEACKLILQQFETYFADSSDDSMQEVELNVKLIVPASQCGPLIGKGGSKIKEIRDMTGASMQVAGEMLPSSSERVVNIAGSAESVLDCIYEICLILLSSPQKFQIVPYRPNFDLLEGPIIFAENKVYTLQGSTAVPIADLEFLYKNELIKQFLSVAPGSLDYSVLSRLVKSEPRDPSERRQPFATREIKVPEDAVNDLFSRHGTKVSEIKQITGARIHLSSPYDGPSDGRDKFVTIKGPIEAVTLAEYLIKATIELLKMNPEMSIDQSDMDYESANSSLTNSLTRVGFGNVSDFLSNFDSYHRH